MTAAGGGQHAEPPGPSQDGLERSTAPEPLIRITDLSKRFGDFVAVDSVNLDIERRELFSILGGSGCGKTTLLRMLAGF